MSEHTNQDSSPIAITSALATAAFVQAWENIRHIRNERIWFTNAYTAVVAGGLAVLQRGVGSSTHKALTAIGLVVLVLFSVASLMSSIRLVAELQIAITNLQRIVNENGIRRLVGMIEAPRGFAKSLPIRWVFPIFYGLTTASLLVLLVVHLFQ